MSGVNGMDAARTMLGFGTWRSGYCLEAVWTAYSQNGAQDRTGQSEPTAYDAWLHTDGKHEGTPFKDVPAGVPVYFGPKASSSAGDIVISVGNGMCVATDIPGRPGVIGKMSLSDRQAQIGRPYLGWTSTILDYPIDYTTQEDDMALDHDDVERIAKAVWTYESQQNNVMFGDMTRRTYDSMRYGEKGVNTTGDGLAELLDRLGRIELKLDALEDK